MHPNFPDAPRIWGDDRIKYFVESMEYRQLHDFAGGLVEFAWRRYVGQTRIQLLKYRQLTLAEDGVTPSEFKGRIIFKCTRLELVAKNKNENLFRQNAIQVASCAKDFELGRWSFLGFGEEEEWYGSLIDKPLERWNSTAEMMMQEIARSGHPVSRCSSPRSRGVLKSTGGGWS